MGFIRGKYVKLKICTIAIITRSGEKKKDPV